MRGERVSGSLPVSTGCKGYRDRLPAITLRKTARPYSSAKAKGRNLCEAEGNALLPTLELKTASTNWLFAAGSYVGFCMLWLVTFMAAMGATANSRKEAALGGALGAVAFSAAVIIVALGLLANIAQVNGTENPCRKGEKGHRLNGSKDRGGDD